MSERGDHQQRPETAAASSPASGWAIELEKINKRFGAVHANKDIDLKVARGTIHGIVGENGAGKSTLLALLAGLDEPSRGQIWLNGADLTALDEDGRAAVRARHVGFVFQSFHLVPSLTAIENVMLPLELAGLPNALKAVQDYVLSHRRNDRNG